MSINFLFMRVAICEAYIPADHKGVYKWIARPLRRSCLR